MEGTAELLSHLSRGDRAFLKGEGGRAEGNRGSRTVRELKNYKKQEEQESRVSPCGTIWVCSLGLVEVGLLPFPRGLESGALPSGVYWLSQLSRQLEFLQAGTEVLWEGGVESSEGCGCELLATV